MSDHDAQLALCVEWGFASRSVDRAAESGDRCIVTPTHEGALLVVVDGLGHGEKAAEAAQVAVATVHEFTDSSILSIFSRCHERLKGTRGVVMSLALINAAERTMTWAGVGNVEGLLIRGGTGSEARKSHLIQSRGVIGDRLPPLVVSTKSMSEGDIVICFTDGIRTGFDEVLNLRSPPQQIANAILASHRRGDDDALVLVARYLGS